MGRRLRLSRRDVDLHRTEVSLGGADPFRMSLVDFGKAEGGTAVFVHGAAGHLLQWHNQLTYFAPRLRVVALDFRGHGQSEATASSRYDFTGFVDDLETALDTLELPERFFLVSHSFGGAVAAGYAVRRPERLQGLVLASTAGDIPLNPSVHILLKLPAFMLGGVQRMVKNAVSTPPHVLKKMVSHVSRWNGWDLYPQIRVPTQVISGELDWLTRPKPMKRMAELIPDASLERIQFAGHLPQLERPARVNAILERFLLPSVKRSWRGMHGDG